MESIHKGPRVASTRKKPRAQASWLMGLVAVGVLLTACRGEHSVEKAVPVPGKAGSIHVRVTGLRSSGGRVLVSLFDSAEGFPNAVEKAFRYARVDPEEGECAVVLENVPRGNYAVAVLHDENGNDRMDTGRWGLPAEGYGVSLNPQPRMGPPRYEDARFSLDSDLVELEIEMRYMTAGR